MRISEMIARLQELQDVASADVEVAIQDPADEDRYESAQLELCYATPVEGASSDLLRWVSYDKDNTEQIVSIW